MTAGRHIAEQGHPGQLVILESTTYPGTTREVLLPALARQGRSPLLAYSPERIDPGGTSDITSVPKLVAGIDDESTELAVALYESVFADVRPVRTVEIAEAAKLLENTFRAVNIALVNELKVALTPLGIDIWEVVEAAASKPFGFMPFYPGPGVGGHCIPVDPEYLAWKGRRGAQMDLTETALRVNAAMPRYVVERLADALASRQQQLQGSSVLIVGMSYKPGIGDVRESPAFSLVEELTERGAAVEYHDPYVPAVTLGSSGLRSVPWEPSSLANYDVAIICTDHDDVDYSLLARSRIVVLDTRNAMAKRGFADLENLFTA